MLIDTHCHLNNREYNDVDKVIEKMKDGIIILSASNVNDFKEIINLCEKHKNIYGTLGIHPEYASEYKKEDLIILENYLKHPKIVGIGEIGLDYYWVKDNKKKQQELFVKQIKLANKYKLPIVIHSRDSIEDTYNIIKKEKNQNIKCDLHCYSGSLEMAKKFIPLNSVFGISGVLTFKKEKKLKEIVEKIDLKYFVLETDSPYLTPEPFRGKRNEPIYTKNIAEKMADIRNQKMKKIVEITGKNACELFDIKIKT